MKRFTLTMMGLLLLLGGASIQAQTVNLPIKGGYNWDATDGTNNWNQSSDVSYTSGTVTLRDNAWGYNNGIGQSCLGGSHWAQSYYTGETHTFTLTLENDSPEGIDLYIAALQDDLSSDKTGQRNDIVYATINTTNTKTLTLEINKSYVAVFVYSTSHGGITKTLKIKSITRTITTASSVNPPTIALVGGGTTFDGDLSVSITKGEDNTGVDYSITGVTSSTVYASGSFTAAELEAGSKTVNLSAEENVTVSATGYKDNEASNEVSNTYTYGISSGKAEIASYNKDNVFTGWGNNIQINQSNFSGLEMNDYVVLNVQDVANNGTLLGFRCDNSGWQEYPYVNCTTVSSGNGAKGTFNVGDTQWWLKVSNNNVLSAFKNYLVVIQGGVDGSDNPSSITLNSVEAYKSHAISESENNTITSKINDVVVELTRSFVAGTWNTVCLPFSLSAAQATQLFGEGYKLAEFTGVNGTSMQFTTTNTFEAGVPYLVKPTIAVSNASPVVLVDVNITAKTPQTVTKSNGTDNYSFVGNFTQKTFSGDECNSSLFVATGNELKKPNNNSTLKSLRCYFTVPAGSIASARSFTIVDEEGGTTSVADVRSKMEDVRGEVFNLAGQRVAQPTKGLYIVNGKKVVIK